MTEKELIDFVKQKIKKRETRFIKGERSINFHKVAKFTCVIMLVFLIGLSFLIFLGDGPKHLLALTSILKIMAIGVILHSQILLSSRPQNEKEKDEWIWKQAKRLYFIKNSVVILSIVSIAIMAIFSKEQLSEANIWKQVYFMLLAVICELLANLITIYIAFNPRRIIDGYLTGLGSLLKFLGVSIGTIIVISFMISSKSTPVLLLMFYITYHFGLFLKYMIFGYRKSQLNLIQKSLLEFINPITFYAALRSELNIIKDKRKAVRVIEKLRKQNKYGVELALLEELTIRHTNKKHWAASFLIGLILFIIYSIGEGFFQDLIYEPLKTIFNK